MREEIKFFNILEVTGRILVQLVSGKIFIFSILSSLFITLIIEVQFKATILSYLYQVSPFSSGQNKVTQAVEDNSPFKPKKNNPISSPLDIIKPTAQGKISKAQLEISSNNLWQKSAFGESIRDKDANANPIQNVDQLVTASSSKMKTRYRYSFSVLDVLYNFMWPFKMLTCCKVAFKGIHARYRLFEKGKQKYFKEFDAAEFAHNQRKFKMMFKMLMSNRTQMLAVYQKSNVIELESKSESSPTEDPEYTAVPKMLASAETKQRHILAIDKLMNECLKDSIKRIDLQALYGVFTDCSYYEINSVNQNKSEIENDVDENMNDNDRQNMRSPLRREITISSDINQTNLSLIKPTNQMFPLEEEKDIFNPLPFISNEILSNRIENSNANQHEKPHKEEFKLPSILSKRNSIKT